MSISLKKAFINSENVFMLWDIISENPTISNQTKSSIEEISQLFVAQAIPFFEKETVHQKNISLLELNKKYMIYFIDHIKSTSGNRFMSKIKIHDDIPFQEPITFQEIQKMKETEFNTRLNHLSRDFREANTLKIPELPNFRDEYQDKPIVNMDENIKQMIQQRQYEFTYIQPPHPETNEIKEKKNVQFAEETETIHTQDHKEIMDELLYLKQRIQILEDKLRK